MQVTPKFIIEPLDPAKHRREDFDCGVTELNAYLQRNARKEMDAGLAVCFVAVPKNEETRIAGFYTLSAATIERADLPEGVTKKLARYREFPGTLLGRLARSIDFKGRGLGNHLMLSAFSRTISAAGEVASWALVTDPKDESAEKFYKDFGFQKLTESRMYLPVSLIAKNLGVTAP